MIVSHSFKLDPQLDSDTFLVTDLALNRVLLMNDIQFPWCILVPRIANTVEITELTEHQRNALWQESDLVSRAMHIVFNPDKLNIGALGNVVSQLHIHHVARYHHDAVWPKPVWGQLPAKPYSVEQAKNVIEQLQQQLKVVNL